MENLSFLKGLFIGVAIATCTQYPDVIGTLY
jgi:hypothetical protein